ncbi:hypothetical protein [Rhodococcus sp. USK13]|uniref:hypothetical protein n=1 Tax=Rhodococcus sp. USK13 TaxID=2806442 RepID=UPI001BCB1913|nr:hypothetical protein [Rhodococcus sp. USK13]
MRGESERLPGALTAIALLLGGLVAGYVFGDTRTGHSVLDSTARFDAASSIVSGTVLAAVAAAIAAVVLNTRGELPTAPFITALFGFGVVTAGALGAVPDPGARFSTPIGAGVLLGALAVYAGRRPAALIALATGVLISALVGNRLDEMLRVTSLTGSEFGWTAYTPVDSVPPPERALVVVAVVFIAVIALVTAHLIAPPTAGAAGHLDRRTLGVGVVLPVIGGVLSWVFVAFTDRSWVWFVGAAAVAVTAWTGAHLLRGRDGALILVLVAISGCALSSGFWVAESAVVLLIPAVLLIGGAVCGYRWPRLYAGMVALGVIACSSLLDFAGLDLIPSVAYYLMFPLVAGFTAASVLPMSGVGAAIALSAPFTLSITVTAFVAGAGAMPPLMFLRAATSPDPAAVTIVSVLLIGVCLLGLRSLATRTT